MKAFRIFISSTFSDHQFERDALQHVVYPQLRNLCSGYGIHFQAIDLRWGISREAAQDQKTMDICFEEIQRCQVTSPRLNFIFFLGDRYGWRPLPNKIAESLFETILKKIDSCPDNKDWKNILLDWYKKDNNAFPPQYELKPREDKFIELTLWSKIEATIKDSLRKFIQDIPLSPQERLKFEGSATEQEIEFGACMPEAKDQAFGFFRKIHNETFDIQNEFFFDIKDGKIDLDARGRLNTLKAKLRNLLPGSIHEYETRGSQIGISREHIPQFCKDVYNSLSQLILSEIKEWKQDESFEHEKQEHIEFSKIRTKNFVGRFKILTQIEDYIISDTSSPLVIVGESGLGKTSLIAKAVEKSKITHLDTVVICRFIAVTPNSSNSRLLLLGLCHELSRSYGVNDAGISEDYDELVKTFRNNLTFASSSKPLIIFIDALDQLIDVNSSFSFSWIPTILPPYVRIIVSILPHLHSLLIQIVENDKMIELMPMLPSEGEELLDCWFSEVNRTLQDKQRKVVFNKFINFSYPLYLKVIFEKIRHWKSYQSNLRIGSNTSEAINNLFNELSDESNHGAIMVSHTLAYLVCSKNGLAEDELLDILNSDAEVMAEFRERFPFSPVVEKLPPIIWSRFYSDLAPYLITRDSDNTILLIFFHRQFTETVIQKFLPKKVKRVRHRKLAKFFTDQPLFLDDYSRQIPNLRKLSEQPFQQTLSEDWQEAKNTLLDYSFIEAKIGAFNTNALLDDFELLISSLDNKITGERKKYSNVLRQVKDAIQLSSDVFLNNTKQLPSHLIGRLCKSDNSDIKQLLRKVRPTGQAFWLRPLTQSLRSTGGPLVCKLGGHGAIVWKVIVSQSGRFAVSFANDQTIVVWDLKYREEKYRLNWFKESISAIALDDSEKFLVCSSGSDLFLIDLIRGIKLKQYSTNRGWIKSLVFNPHNQSIIFATDSEGLLQWNLYTNNIIPCIEKTVAAISSILLIDKGNKAVTATRNENSISPSQIIVWDLNFGTIIKKWNIATGMVWDMVVTPNERKLITAEDWNLNLWDIETGEMERSFIGHSPWINSVSLTSDGKWLISGSADQKIKIWNLLTGEEHATLKGHHGTVRSVTAVADTHIFLSGSDDQTVRLWDIDRIQTTGETINHTGKINDLRITPDDQYVISASDDGVVKIWNIRTGKLLRPLVGHTSQVWSIAISSVGNQILSLQNGAMIIIWDLTTGIELNRLNLVPRSIFGANKLVVSPNGKHFFLGEEMFEIDTGKVVYALPEYECKVINFLTEEKILFYGNRRPLKVWDLKANKEIATLPNNSSIGIVYNETMILVGSTLKFLDLRTYNLEYELELKGHRGEITSISEVAKGLIASACGDHDLRIWDLKSKLNIATFTAEAPLSSCVLTRDGDVAIAGDWLGNLHFLKIEKEETN